jgi:hypothetical protein
LLSVFHLDAWPHHRAYFPKSGLEKQKVLA